MKNVLLGGGGHSRAIFDILIENEIHIDILVGIDTNDFFSQQYKIEMLARDEELLRYRNNEVCLINGVGPKARGSKRAELSEFYERLGYSFQTLIASSAKVSKFSEVSDGCQIMHRAVLNISSKIGRHSIINTAAVIEHDVQIGEHSFIGPNASVCGGVNIGARVFIGVGSVIFPGVNIGSDAIISGGSIVKRDVGSREVFV